MKDAVCRRKVYEKKKTATATTTTTHNNKLSNSVDVRRLVGGGVRGRAKEKGWAWCGF